MSFHIEYPRTLPLQRPGDFQPGAPKFHARWDSAVTTLVCDYIAVQRDRDDLTSENNFFERLQRDFDSEFGPDCAERMRMVDEAGKTNSIIVAYWTDPSRYAFWKFTAAFNAWLQSAEREAEDVGYWRETLVVPYDRLETIYSEPEYRVGLNRTKGCNIEPMYTAGYFGAMRDRLPISAVDGLNSPYETSLPKGAFEDGLRKRIRVDIPHNLVSIRSGQYWQKAEGEQLADYYENLQPKLEVGMSYIKDNPLTTGCLSLRAMVNLDQEGNELRETSKHGYFISLAFLERWASSHKSHLDIFKHALAMRRKYGAERSVVTWHEVFVLGSSPSFEYVNCHAETGLLKYANLWGSAPIAR
ncbi:phenylacetaldoxime dehydratase [Caballeronia fortuita]|uniref:Phenylacetaldoxime dehydratase n=1 Tax=Caballeronia fortuita TaxID=1777138 RepID=A0A158CTJ3_9BURK|nr:phenylacetaldoxime dehydratase family protein [Caballeronia fortuita]SAK85551.1 phenylacetaldoxime dehydratase [Caballeronia fortuita]